MNKKLVIWAFAMVLVLGLCSNVYGAKCTSKQVSYNNKCYNVDGKFIHQNGKQGAYGCLSTEMICDAESATYFIDNKPAEKGIVRTKDGNYLGITKGKYDKDLTTGFGMDAVIAAGIHGGTATKSDMDREFQRLTGLRKTAAKPKDPLAGNPLAREGSILYKDNRVKTKNPRVYCVPASKLSGWTLTSHEQSMRMDGIGSGGGRCFEVTSRGAVEVEYDPKKNKILKRMSTHVISGNGNDRAQCIVNQQGEYISCQKLTCKDAAKNKECKLTNSYDFTGYNVRKVDGFDKDQPKVKIEGELCASDYFVCQRDTIDAKYDPAKKIFTFSGGTIEKDKSGFNLVKFKEDNAAVLVDSNGVEYFRGTYDKSKGLLTPEGQPVTIDEKNQQVSWKESNGFEYTINSKTKTVTEVGKEGVTSVYASTGQPISISGGGVEFKMRDSNGKDCTSGVDCIMRDKKGAPAALSSACNGLLVKMSATKQLACEAAADIAARGGRISWLGVINAFGSGVATASSLCGLAKNSAFCSDAALSYVNDFFEGHWFGQAISGRWEDMICMNWHDLQGGDNGAILDLRTGYVSSWVAGQYYPFAEYNETEGEPMDKYTYKYSFEVNPMGICDLPNIPEDPHTPLDKVGLDFKDEFIRFKLVLKPGYETIDLDKGPGDDYFKIPCNMSVYRISGANSIIRKTSEEYSQICLQFLDVEGQTGRNLRGPFQWNLDDQKYLCNKISETEFVKGEAIAESEGALPEGSYVPTIVND